MESSFFNSELNSDIASLKDLFYPIGAIVYGSTSDFDSEAKIKARYGGNTWTKIEGRMLLGTDSSHSVGSTGGTSSITSIPKHTHSFTPSGSVSSHTHTLSSHTHGFAHTHTTPKTSTGRQNYTLSAGGSAEAYTLGKNVGTTFSMPDVPAMTTNSQSTSTTGGPSNNTSGSATPTFTGTAGTTGSTGNDSVSVLNPYKAVYIWERTA